MSHFELAQLNIAQIIAPLESPLLAEFVANLDRINAAAEAAPVKTGVAWETSERWLASTIDRCGNAAACTGYLRRVQ